MASEFHLDFTKIDSPNDWALEVCRVNRAHSYFNLGGGREIYQAEKFELSGVSLNFRDMKPMKYKCGNFTFIENLSIIDVMMWNPVEQIKAFLDVNMQGIEPVESRTDK